jgi:hypothetical protein
MGNRYTIFRDEELGKNKRGADTRFTMGAMFLRNVS